MNMRSPQCDSGEGERCQDAVSRTERQTRGRASSLSLAELLLMNRQLKTIDGTINA